MNSPAPHAESGAQAAPGTRLPTISIVTVVRNDAEGLRRTLESIATQDYPALESIVIDGASSDDTPQVIHARAAMLASWCSEADRGIYHAMNKGVARAGGELTLFLNAADTLPEPGTLSRFVAGCARPADRARPPLYLCAIETDKGVVKGPRLLWLKQHYMMPSYHQGMIYATGLLREVPFSEDYRIAADVHHFLKVRRKASLVPCPNVLARYDTTGISSVNVRERDREFHRIYRELGVAYPFRLLKRLHELHAWLRD